MTNIDYTLWPNTDGELGKIKVSIPTNAEDWPAGDALVGNFVYNNGKLVGFVDTKALILNESATTTFPYDYVDIYLPSIQEGTLTINRGERCKYLNVKMYRADWLPSGYTELEYLETSGTQYIKVPHKFNDLTGIQMSVLQLANANSDFNWPFAEFLNLDDVYKGNRMDCWATGFSCGVSAPQYTTFSFSTPETEPPFTFSYNYKNNRKVTANGVTDPRDIYAMDSVVEGKTMVFGITWDWLNERQNSYSFVGRYYYINLSQGESADMDLTPVLDENGTPCMYDKVSKKCFYNAGSGSFGYRIKTTDDSVAPFSLRDPYYVAPSGVYAKLIAENELEIIADTEEVQGDDWVHFANTSEAYEYFGITFEDEILV